MFLRFTGCAGDACVTLAPIYFYIFWECPNIQPFWSTIQAHLQGLFETSLPLDPIHYLVDLPFPGILRHTQKFAAFILLVAKRAIPLRWLSPFPPSLPQVLQILDQIRRMEHLTAIVHASLAIVSFFCLATFFIKVYTHIHEKKDREILHIV